MTGGSPSVIYGKPLQFERDRQMTMRRFLRITASVATGGLLLQTAGCATTIAPLALSLMENIVLSQLTGGLGGAF